MKYFFNGLRGLVISALVLWSPAAFPQAALLPDAKQQFLDANGNPLAGGSVTHYVPGTTTKKTTWSNSTQSAVNSNPLTLDSAGRAIIFGQGSYRQVVKDSSGAVVWDQTTIAPTTTPSTFVTDLAPVGTILPFAGFTPPSSYLFAYGQELSRTTYSELLDAITSSQSGQCTIGSSNITALSDTSQMRVGAPIEASCLTAGTTITAVTGSTSVTVSAVAISSATVSMRVFPWGNGNGGTTFNAPDMRGRTLAGRDNMGGTAANVLTYTYCSGASALLSLGSYCGGQSHVMTLSELVGHTHSVSGTTSSDGVNHTHTAGSYAVSIPSGQGSHTHSSVDGNNFVTGTPSGVIVVDGGTSVRYSSVSNMTTAATLPALTGSVSGGSSGNASAYLHTHTFSATSSSTGSASAFSVVQPVSVTNFIVKYTSYTPSGAGGVLSIGGMTGDILCGSGIVCDLSSLTLNSTASSVGPISFDTSSATVVISSTMGMLVLNKSSTTTVQLPAASSRSGFPVEIVLWSGLEGNVTVVPDGADTIMGLSSWTLTALGVSGGGMSVRLVPITGDISGWTVR